MPSQGRSQPDIVGVMTIYNSDAGDSEMNDTSVKHERMNDARNISLNEAQFGVGKSHPIGNVNV